MAAHALIPPPARVLFRISVSVRHIHLEVEDIDVTETVTHTSTLQDYLAPVFTVRS